MNRVDVKSTQRIGPHAKYGRRHTHARNRKHTALFEWGTRSTLDFIQFLCLHIRILRRRKTTTTTTNENKPAMILSTPLVCCLEVFMNEGGQSHSVICLYADTYAQMREKRRTMKNNSVRKCVIVCVCVHTRLRIALKCIK